MSVASITVMAICGIGSVACFVLAAIELRKLAEEYVTNQTEEQDEHLGI